MVLLVVLLWAFFGKVALTIQFYLWSEFGQEIKLNICCCCLSSPWLVEGMTGDDGAGCAADGWKVIVVMVLERLMIVIDWETGLLQF